MKVNMNAVNREMVKRARKDHKKNTKPDNRKRSRSTKTYYEIFDDI
jgi:hypothetical protein